MKYNIRMLKTVLWLTVLTEAGSAVQSFGDEIAFSDLSEFLQTEQDTEENPQALDDSGSAGVEAISDEGKNAGEYILDGYTALSDALAAIPTDYEKMQARFGEEFLYPMCTGSSVEDTTLPGLRLDDYRYLREFPLPEIPCTISVLKAKIEKLISAYDGTWSVYIKNLKTEESIYLNPVPMKSASVMKLFILAAVYDAFEQKTLTRTDDIISLLQNMISYSSNEAANKLLTILGNGSAEDGIQIVNHYLYTNGYSRMSREYNGFEDSAYVFNSDSFNRLTARDCGLFLEKIYHRSIFSRTVCNEIEAMLLNQQTRYKLPKGLPSDVLIANKTGEMDTVENDVALIYGKKSDYILCVMSMDWEDKSQAQNNFSVLSSLVYDFFDQEDYYESIN